ncbi:AMP-binding protein [Halostagnicola sp. A-GB9-2]|uniref:class I adenylate-forming enzyme family protein n=1 Tax=Halostagnicola sp. A-GB9-2 TaxID=3048066 RepID=UPI0024BFF0C7|nr:AMP-binding protein [Halostagnicola sp. A-GB9-2]MDJ1430880.1 AMP-binding protein [Halostagnicola sp. A-GB9-2]
MMYHHGERVEHMGTLPTMSADRYGDKTAFSFMGTEQSYNELEAESNTVANVLVDHGVEPGDRVGLFIPNTNQFPAAYFGAIKAGAVATPLNLRMDPETLAYVINDAGANVVIASAFLADEAQGLADAAGIETLFLPGVEDVERGIINYSHALMEADDEFEQVEREYGDIAAQPYTSGTTGQPKGVMLSHRNLLSTIGSYSKGGLAVGPEDSLLLVLPLFHIYALNALLGSFVYSGSKMILQPKPEPENMLTAIDEHQITKFAGVPAMYTMMFREYRENPDAYDLSSLEDVTCAAAPLAEDVRRTIEEAWETPVLEGWGMTETSPAGTLEPSIGVHKEAGCIGPPLPGIDLKIVDPDTRETMVGHDDLHPTPSEEIDFEDEEAVTGELAIRGDNVFEGYYNQPEKTAEVLDDEGWFYTEDIARVDADGYFWMVDRADDMIIAGGENIYPAEVESALYEHPDVAEAAVVAAPHEVKGEAPVGYVVLEEGADITERELREFSLDYVATYAHPRRIFTVDELPRSATQKVQRYKLEEDLEERLDEPLESGTDDL